MRFNNSQSHLQPTTYDYRLKGNEFLQDSNAGYLFPGGGTTVFANGGQIGVAAGKRLTLRNQLTLGAKLVKKGAGTLALGGPLRFSSEQREEPLPDMDVLSVEAGALRGLNNGAVNGLKVELFEDAAIEIASPTETISDDERTYGLYSVNENGYIVLMDGVLNVRLSEEGRYDADGADLWPVAFSQAICTVANGEVDGLKENFKFVDCPRGVKLVSIEPVANADGETTTFVAHFKRSGFSIIVR